MPWQARLSARAQRDLRKLGSSDQAAVHRALNALADDPGSVDLKKLSGRQGEWRVRVGSLRAIVSQ